MTLNCAQPCFCVVGIFKSGDFQGVSQKIKLKSVLGKLWEGNIVLAYSDKQGGERIGRGFGGLYSIKWTINIEQLLVSTVAKKNEIYYWAPKKRH